MGTKPRKTPYKVKAALAQRAAFLESLPEEVRSARSILAAWLAKYEHARTRALGRVKAARTSRERLEGEMEEGGLLGPKEQALQIAWGTAWASESRALSALYFWEVTLLSVCRPDLSEEPLLAAAAGLVNLWAEGWEVLHEWEEEDEDDDPRGYRLSDALQNWLFSELCGPSDDDEDDVPRSVKRKREPEVPRRLFDPKNLLPTLQALRRDVERNPGSYGQRERRAILECQHVLEEAFEAAVD